MGMKRRILCRAVVLGLVSTVLLTATGCAAIESVIDPVSAEPVAPGTELEPEEVVRVQVEALQAASADDLDGELLYAFASADYRAAFDGVSDYAEHFTRRPYRPLIGHIEARYHPLELDNGLARQDVTVTTEDGETRRFGFLLTRSVSEDCDGCWLIEAVRAYLD